MYPGEFGDARLAGKTVSYDITVKAIKHKEDFPERDDEFAKELGAYESWAEFEAKLRERAGRRKAGRPHQLARRRRCSTDMLSKYNFPLPESFVQQLESMPASNAASAL